ncbi:MAG: MFS transporter [Actinobacteria bacterium]|nr:MFS transporter [Actinomycetota bacterium]
MYTIRAGSPPIPLQAVNWTDGTQPTGSQLAHVTKSSTAALLALLAATAMFRLTQNMAITTFSLLGRERLGIGPGTLGVLAALSGLVMVGSTLTIAARIPVARSVRMAAVGAALLAGALLVFAVAPSLAVFTAAIVILGIAGGLGMPGLTNAAGSVSAEARERALALYTLTLSASLAVGPLVETFVLDAAGQDIRAPFVSFLVFPILAATVLIFRCRISPVDTRRRSPSKAGDPAVQLGHESSPAQALGGQPPQVGAISPRATRSRHWSALRRWPASKEGASEGIFSTHGGRLAITGLLLYAVPFAGITVFGALIARIAFGVSAADAQLAFTAFFVTSFAARAAIAWRAPITHKVAMFWLAAGLSVTGLLLLAVGHGLGLLLVAMAVLGIPHGLTFPMALSLVAESTAPRALPRANAVMLATTNMSTVLMPAILGSLVAFAGYRGMVLFILIPVLGFSSLLWVQRRPQADHAVPSS